MEQSCLLLQGFLPEGRKGSAGVAVAYVQADVETVQDYARERAKERGLNPNGYGQCEWENAMHEQGVYNRALVLACITRGQDSSSPELNSYDEESLVATSLEVADEEDMFLTRRGIEFARTTILSTQITKG